MEYPIGTQYLSTGKNQTLCTITDIWTTTDHAGNVVKVQYVATHEFMGQTITERDVCAVTIAKGLHALSHRPYRGYTILYAPYTRTWGMASATYSPMCEFPNEQAVKDYIDKLEEAYAARKAENR